MRTLTDGGQPALGVAQLLALFLGEAQASLDIAQYDFHLGAETGGLVGSAIRDAAKRGVQVRIVYDVDHPNPIPVPPPPEPDVEMIESLGVPSRPIAGVPDLMHHKYVVRDGQTVWTGSVNWTDDSWSRQENVFAIVDSPGLARAYALDFEELWEDGVVATSGTVEPRPVEVDGLQVRPWFTPGNGEALSHRIAKAIGKARRRVRICSPVITASPVLSTLAQIAAEGRVDTAGCVDATQMADVKRQWIENGNVDWKLPLLDRLLSLPFTGKNSTPWAPGALHDYMHAKVTVADDTVFLGSFNLSRSGERNAENMLELRDATLADSLAVFVDEVRVRYPKVSLP